MKVPKYRRSTWILVAMVVYVTCTAIYLLPHNLMETSGQKWLAVLFCYIIVIILWRFLRRKENLHR
jgi:hypothetical protein